MGAKSPRPRRARPQRRRKNVPAGRERTVNNPAWGRSLPAAYASHVRPRFNYLSRTNSAVRVAGCDLVYPVPATVTSQGDYLFVIIPCNPAYWTGTRIAQLAPAYMNYRPLRMTFSYIPQVAVTQQGTVAMGTLWNGAAGDEDIQQTLFTSNGGCLTQCYVPCDTTIRLGRNLQQNLFTLAGAITPETSPFIFCAALRGATVIPGYFYVSYEFEFKNPIGQAWTYTRSEVMSSASITEQSLPNSSVILLSQSGTYGPGTVFDLEGSDLFYHGTPVTLADAPIQIFSNGQTQGVAARNAQLLARVETLEDTTVSTYLQSGVERAIPWTAGFNADATLFATLSGSSWTYVFASSAGHENATYSALVPNQEPLTLILNSGARLRTLQYGTTNLALYLPPVPGTPAAAAEIEIREPTLI